MDRLLGELIKELQNINIFDKMNIVIVSDHGMQLLAKDSNIALNATVSLDLVNRQKSVYGVVSNIYPASNDKVDGFSFLF